MKQTFTKITLSLCLAFLFQTVYIFGQTTIISPTGDGGFETGTTFAANGWIAANGSATTRVWYCGTGQTGYSGARAAMIGTSTTTVGTTTTSRPAVHLYRSVTIPAGATSISLSFKYKQATADNTYDYLKVFLNGNTPVYATAQTTGLLTTLDPSSTSNPYTNFANVNVTIPNSLAGTTNNLIFTFTADGLTPHAYGAIDDVSLTYIAPSCLAPITPVVSAITTTSATLSWTAPSPAPANGYEYYVSTSSTAPIASTVATGTIAAGTTTKNLILSSATTYYAWVRSVCAVGDLSVWASIAAPFSTPCLPFNVPYTQNFDTGVTPPALAACTSQEDTNADTYKWLTSATSAISTPNSVQISYNSTTTTIAMNDWFFTGGINLTAGTSYRLSFKYKGTCVSFTEKLEVKYGTSATSSAMTSTAIFNQVGITTLTTATVDFTPTTSGVYYLGFHGYSAANQCTLVVDDILLDLSPSCLPPTGVNVTGITTTGATLNWTAPGGSPTSYDVYYSPTNTAPIATTTPVLTGITATTTPLSGLSAISTYYAWVRTNCGASGTSAWTTAFSFSTSCTTYNTPYTLNFDTGVTPPALANCTSQEDTNADTYKWISSTSNAISAPNAMQISYNSTNTTVAMNDWFFTGGINMTAGVTYRLTFKYKGTCTTTFSEKLEVKYGASPTSTTMTSAAVFNKTGIVTLATATVLFVPSTSGINYLGFHGYSDADQCTLVVDDILLEDLPLCTGIPSPSNTISSAGTSVCSGVTSVLTLSSTYTNSGISYQWESAAAGTGSFSPIAGATSASYTATISAATDYQCKIVCANSSVTITSTPVSIALNLPTLCYCSASLHSGFAPCITNISFGTLSNNTTSSGCALPSYTAFPSTTTMTLTKTVATPMTYTFDAAAIASVWIDYNRNGTFEAAEWTQLTTSGTTGTVSITAPATAQVGTTGMRIRSRLTANANGSADACTLFGSGETEDYQITIVENCINSANVTTATGLVQLTDACEQNGWTNYKTSGGPVLFAVEWEPAGSTTSNAVAKANSSIEIFNEGAINNGLIYNSSLGTTKSVVTGYGWNVNLNGTTLTHPVNVRVYYPTAMVTTANSVLTASGFSPITTSWFKTKDAPYSGSTMTNFFTPVGLDTTTTKVALLTPAAGYPQVVSTVAGGTVSLVQFNAVTSFSGGSFVGTAGVASVLPLVLTDFRAKINGKVNTLTWSTESEQNTLRFDIERSIDGVHFVKIGEKKAEGNSNRTINYVFNDQLPLCNAYYRLLMVDKDGRTDVSPTVVLDRKCKNFVIANVFPNPTNSNATIQFETPEKATVEISVIDLFGRTLIETTFDAYEGINATELDLQKLPAGNYFVRLNNGKNWLQQKIVKN
jgi:hypothetical protein